MPHYETYNCISPINFHDNSIFLGTINPYIGCEHNCKYCYVQGEKYSPYKTPKEFSNRIKVKSNIVELLNSKLKRINKNNIICIGSSSDPYQPAENIFGLTEKILNLLVYYDFYVHIFTKSQLILKNIDILRKHKKKLIISFSIITTSEKIRKIFEPNLPPLKERFNAVKKLSDNEISVGVAIMPVLPFISDNEEELERVFYYAKKCGCKYFWWSPLTLRSEQKKVYYDVLSKNYPDLIKRYETIYGNYILPDKKYISQLSEKILFLSKKYGIPNDLPLKVSKKKFVQEEFKFKAIL